ncbi:hypothetical protein CHELA1G11_40049 [Hyphomicrobiales bacterium]|nr:hypothetical protein CHELA1G11_40049 [Hyphomicrobiales bacterium]CAH1696490.1 hypothetical protein CHELA1G2_40092 [Hyphomicrobiales bacterium]
MLGQHRSTQRRIPHGREDEEKLIADIVELVRRYGRYGYRKIAALLRSTAGWVVNDKRVERIWRREGLKVPARQPKRGRLWLADGSCIRLRAERPNHVWSYDFVEDRTHDGRKYRMLNIIDEFTHECLAIRIDRKLRAIDVIDVLSDLFILRGVPEHVRSDNGPEFVAKAVQDWISAVGAKAAYIAPGRPWENSFIESFNARLRDELLDGEILYTLAEAKIIVESCGATSTPCARMAHSDTSLPPRRSSSPPWGPHGRLRNPDQLRRPRWRRGQHSTNNNIVPLGGADDQKTRPSTIADGLSYSFI